MTKRGVSAVEVLLATAVVAIALVAVMGQSQAQLRQAYFSEYHMQAQWRAAAVLGVLATQRPEELEKLVSPSGLPAGGGEISVPDALLVPASRVALEWLPAARFGPGKGAAELTSPARAPLFRARAWLAREVPGPAGTLLWRVRAQVTWTFPGDGREHSYELARLLARPALSHQLRPSLEVR